MSRTRRVSSAIGLALALVAMLGACGSDGADPVAGGAGDATAGAGDATDDAGDATDDAAQDGGGEFSADSLEPIDPASVETKTVRVAVDNPHYLFQVDPLVAEDKGYFEEFGIEDYEGTVTDEVVPALLGGSVDLIVFDTDSTMGAGEKTGQKLPVIQMVISQEANILGCREGFETAEDLMEANAKIAVSGRGTRSYVQMEDLLTENGVDLDKVQLLDTGGQSNERLAQTINGTVDCGSMQLRHRSLLEDEGGTFVFERRYDAPQLALATTCEFYEANPNTVAAYVAATLKARQFGVDQGNKDEVLGLMEELGFELPPAFKDAYNIEQDGAYRGETGGWDPELMETLLAEQAELGAIPELDWRDHVELEPLWRAQAQLGIEPLTPDPSTLESGNGGACES